MTSPQSIVDSLCAAWERRDVEGILATLARDCAYRNIPLGTLVGTDAIRPFIVDFLGRWDAVEIVIVNTLSVGSLVMNERIDRFSRGGIVFDLPVAGVFEVADGRVARWTDYWDLGTWRAELAKGGPR